MYSLYRYWAHGNLGMVITGNVMVDKGAMTGPGGVALEKDTDIAPFQKWAKIIKSNGALAIMQINHPGRQVFKAMKGKAIAPSAVPLDMGKHSKLFAQPREMTCQDIHDVCKRFVQTAKQAEKAGFDGVEIHAANGYLLDQFLCSNSNQRTDDYGGSVENRARLVLDVVDAVIAAAGDAGIVGIRISPLGTFNGVEDANPLETFSYLLGELNSRGLAYVHVNKPDWAGGSYEGFDELLAALRKGYKGDFILAGGLDGDSASAALDGGLAQFAAFGRPYIANPDLVARLQAGAPLNQVNPRTLYGGGAEGYTDYPAM